MFQEDAVQEDSKCVHQPLTPQQMSTLALSPAFMYPYLLPFCGFKTKRAPSRLTFHHAEDV